MPAPLPDLVRGRSSSRRVLRAGLPALVAVVALVAITSARNERGGAPLPPERGLPPGGTHFHSLLVDESDSNRLLLGTHFGLYASADRGATWDVARLAGNDVLDLARAKDGTVWAAGPALLAKSSDSGGTWVHVAKPTGLPSLDLRALAISFDVRDRFYAVVSRRGIYRSTDGARTFALLSDEVGPDVQALVETKDGVLVASDAERGLVLNANGDGVEWLAVPPESPVEELAARPFDPVAGGEYRVLASTDDGIALTIPASNGRRDLELSRVVKTLPGGVGAVAWAPSDRNIAYAIGFDRRVYRSGDGGETWAAVK